MIVMMMVKKKKMLLFPLTSDYALLSLIPLSYPIRR